MADDNQSPPLTHTGSNEVTPNQMNPTSTQNPVEGEQQTHAPHIVISEEDSEPKNVNESGSPNKEGLTSQAWVHFHRRIIAGKWKAICKYCDKKLVGDTKMGTKHLHDHISICLLRNKRGTRQTTLKTLAQSSQSGFVGDKGDTFVVGNFSFSQEVGRMELAQMIIVHEYPLSMVEHFGFRRFCGALQPLFKVVSRNTIKSDIMKIYEMERYKTMKLLENTSSRVAITTDMWTSSNQNKGFMAVTAHFIDENWGLQHRLVRFIYVPAPHNAEVLSEKLIECLYDWNLDRKLSTLTVDNCSTNDAMIDHIFEKIPSSSFIIGGVLFHMRCAAHILNLIVKDGLSVIYVSIEKIRESVSYWSATPKREEKFVDTCRQLNIAYSKKLCLDCKTRWNSTFLMLDSALPYSKVFSRLKQRETQFKCCPTDEDWKMAAEICEKLEIFYSVTELFSGSKYPTTNVYFPKVCEIRLSLREWHYSPNEAISKMVDHMTFKFNKYWGLINGVMAIGAVLDPRYKMKSVEYFFPLVYGNECNDEIKRVKRMCEDLIAEYQAKDKRNTSTRSESTSSTLTESGPPTKKSKWQSSLFQYVQETSSESNKSELDCYLEDSVLLDESNEEEFDILGYWKQIGVKYPTLQRIARDFLAIPISTVASESAFSTGGRVLSPNRSRLNEDTVEALMCCQDWLRNIIGGSSNALPQYFTVNEDKECDDIIDSATSVAYK